MLHLCVPSHLPRRIRRSPAPRTRVTAPEDKGLFWQQTSPDGEWAVHIAETDNKVCYAYLYHHRSAAVGARPIAADVWLYNLTPAPQVAEWTLPDARDRLPFLNAAEFVVGDGTLSSVQADQFEVKWSEDVGGVVVADIYLQREHLARLRPGSRPGWSKLARRPNAIAIPLDQA